MESKRLSSSSFPQGHFPKEHSSVHKILEQPYQLVEVKIRPFEKKDIDELVLLHRQWFPLQYGVSFYSKIMNAVVQCKIAEATIMQSGEIKKLIVGVLVYQYEVAGSILKVQKWCEYLCWSSIAIYIMTVGVIDQFRSRGIGKRFLELLINQTNQNPNIKYIHLHMVAYNTASNFYEKNGFQAVEHITRHYNNILGNPEDAKYYVRFFNGGTRRQGWKDWVQSLCGGSN